MNHTRDARLDDEWPDAPPPFQEGDVQDIGPRRALVSHDENDIFTGFYFESEAREARCRERAAEARGLHPLALDGDPYIAVDSDAATAQKRWGEAIVAAQPGVTLPDDPLDHQLGGARHSPSDRSSGTVVAELARATTKSTLRCTGCGRGSEQQPRLRYDDAPGECLEVLGEGIICLTPFAGC